MGRRPGSLNKPKGRKVLIEWTGEEKAGGGGSFRIPPGDYVMEVASVAQETSKQGNPMLTWVFKGQDGPAKNKSFYLYTTLNADALWKLANLLTALGQDVPEEPEEIDLDALVGLQMTGVVGDEEYNGKNTSKIQDFYAVDEEAPAATNGKAAAPAAKAGKPITFSAEEVDAMDEDELQSVIDKHNLDVDLSEFKTPKRRIIGVKAALDEQGLLEE